MSDINFSQNALVRVDRFLDAVDKAVDAFVNLSKAVVSVAKKIEAQIDKDNEDGNS